MTTGPAYRTISDVAIHVGVPQHVLRFWETKFPVIAPLKRGGNRRYYRPDDVAAIERIARLLHVEGYTIKGAQKLLTEENQAVDPAPTGGRVRPERGAAAVDPASAGGGVSQRPPAVVAGLQKIRADLAHALAAARAL